MERNGIFEYVKLTEENKTAIGELYKISRNKFNFVSHK